MLVNNAHASRQIPLVDTTQAHLDLSFNTGFYPTFYLMQAARYWSCSGILSKFGFTIKWLMVERLSYVKIDSKG